MLNVKQIVEATNGKLINGNLEDVIYNYILDSREIKENDFFIPLVGVNCDAQDYIIECSKKNISGCFIQSSKIGKKEIIEECLKNNKNMVIIEVEDNEKALYNIGKYNRNLHMEIPLIAVTGSVGKTSTKEMISSILETEYNVLKTEKNYNSYIGLSLMLLKLDHQDIAVLEHGIDRIGEMDELVSSSRPNFAVITMIGTSHIGIFGSQETIFTEKLAVSKYLTSKLILNGDDYYLSTVNNSNVIKYSINETNKIYTCENSITFNTKIYDNNVEVKINEVGRHNIYNALAGIKVAELFNVSLNNILKGIEQYKNFSRRFEQIKINNDITIIDDTYNASIDSMRSGIHAIDSIKAKRKIAVLGDMLELGSYSKEIHREVGDLFKDVNIDILYTFGEMSKEISNTASKYLTVQHFENKGELIAELKSTMKNGDLIYFKASNGMKFNDIIDKIK